MSSNIPSCNVSESLSRVVALLAILRRVPNAPSFISDDLENIFTLAENNGFDLQIHNYWFSYFADVFPSSVSEDIVFSDRFGD